MDLQIRVNDLAQRYQDAVDTCVNSLNAIQEDGTQGDPLSPFLSYARGRIMAAAGIAAEGIKVVKTRYYSQQTIQFGERSVKLKPALVRESSEYFLIFSISIALDLSHKVFGVDLDQGLSLLSLVLLGVCGLSRNFCLR